MAKKLAHCFYEVSSVESLMVTVTGPDDPYAALDDETVTIQEGIPFTITPKMLSGSGGFHLLNLIFVFPANDAKSSGYSIDVRDNQSLLETVRQATAEAAHTAKVQLMIQVA